MRRMTGATSALIAVLFLSVTLTAGLTAPAGAQAGVGLSAVERDVLAGVNAQRVAHGLVPLRAQAGLMSAARAHSRSMAHEAFFSHDSADGASFGRRLLDQGYGRVGYSAWSVGEDIGSARFGSVAATPQGIVLLWMQSSTHRRVILGGTFRDAGIGIHGADGQRYFTLDLGVRRR